MNNNEYIYEIFCKNVTHEDIDRLKPFIDINENNLINFKIKHTPLFSLRRYYPDLYLYFKEIPVDYEKTLIGFDYKIRKIKNKWRIEE